MRTEGHGPTAEQHRGCSGEPGPARAGQIARGKAEGERARRSQEPENLPSESRRWSTSKPPAGRRGRKPEPREQPGKALVERPLRAEREPRPTGRRTASRVVARDMKRSTRRRSTAGRTTPGPLPRRQGRAPLNELQRTAYNAWDRGGGRLNQSRTTALQRPAPTPNQTRGPATRTEARGVPKPYPIIHHGDGNRRQGRTRTER